MSFRYTCRWPYLNFIQQTSQFVVRVETDLKLNLSIIEDEDNDESDLHNNSQDLISATDSDLVNQTEVHFMMVEGLIN